MESELSPDKEKNVPPVPLKTYQWEDLRRSRDAGGYPWTHLLKPPLEGEITAEDIIRETTPRRSMSRDISRSRTHSPVDGDVQRILNLDSSPGSSRKHGEEGEDEGVHVPKFSKEVSMESEDDILSQPGNTYESKTPDRPSTHLTTPVEIPKNVSPKSILKRRVPEQQYIGVQETREKTKCCHPLVNKIKHLADKTLHKLERSESEKSPISKRKKNEDLQEIRQLRNSPGAVRRQKFSVIKLGDSDEMSKTMSVDTPPPIKKKEHIYEDIEESKSQNSEKSSHFSPATEDGEKVLEENKSLSIKENESLLDKKSNASQDPSLAIEEGSSLKSHEHIMEKVHVRTEKINKEDDEIDSEELNVDEIFQDQLEETRKNDSPNITITEIIDDETESTAEQSTAIPLETSPSPCGDGKRNVEFVDRQWSRPSRRWTSEGGTPIEKPLRPTREGSVQLVTPDVRCACQFFQCDSLLPERVNPMGTRPTSRASNIISNVSDHEYEIIEKPPPNIVYTAPTVVDEKPILIKTDDELSSTTSLERKYLQHTSDEEEQVEDKEDIHDDKNDEFINAQTLQKDIEDRFFVNTPSTVSRTECEISTSQVDSSALENLPLKRDSRAKAMENMDSKFQKKIKEGTGKLKTQAGKLKTKLQNIRTRQFSMPDRPKIKFPERPKFKIPDRSKISLPDRPKFTLPDRRKFSLPDRPKFKNINFSEKLSFGDHKKFSFPDRPKFNMPEMPKLKMPDINFPSIGRKKEYKVENDSTESNKDLTNVATVDFEAKTYPRLFSRKKKNQLPKTSSSPTLNREETPPPTFTFIKKINKTNQDNVPYAYDPEQPREYGNIDSEVNEQNELEKRKSYEGRYNFDKLTTEYMDDEIESCNLDRNRNASSIPDVSPSKQEYTHVINEINNDEFFVRPRGISREDIQVREYLSDEIRQAFKIPKNYLELMGSQTASNNNMYANDIEADPDLMIDENELNNMRYSNEDLNDKDDGYYTFPPVRPSRAKRKKKDIESVQYIDESVNASVQFSEVDIGLSQYNFEAQQFHSDNDIVQSTEPEPQDFVITTDLHSIHEYANDDIIEYPDAVPVESKTLPMPPKRKKKYGKKDLKHSSLNDFKNIPSAVLWDRPLEKPDDIIVYRTEHEYIVPKTESATIEPSPVPPRRNHSRSSRGTSLCDDDRTSHGAESLTLDIHVPPADEIVRDTVRHESPGYATVDKGPYAPKKGVRRSKSKTPPARRRKSNSSERKYYTVGSAKKTAPDRPPRRKSSTSLMTLNSFKKKSVSGDLTQYVEIDETQIEEVHKNLESGEVVNKMKDRPLPPPPRPPRGSRRKKSSTEHNENEIDHALREKESIQVESSQFYPQEQIKSEDNNVIEIEVSTQTDPLPDDVDFELGMDDDIFDTSMNSLKDLVEDESLSKSLSKFAESSRISRPTSRSEKSIKLSDPKISELSKSNIGRTSPTVILVEKRVSSPTRINEHEEMLTEASLTVQHIDIDESQFPDVPPLPKPRGISSGTAATSKNIVPSRNDKSLERVSAEISRDVQLDNLIAQRLQVRDLDVGRLNVSELQASKIMVSDIEGMTLQVTELDSKAGHISVSGIEFSQSVIDEIVKKFAEMSTIPVSASQTKDVNEFPRPVSREEHTQTETIGSVVEEGADKKKDAEQPQAPLTPQGPVVEETREPPQRPPLPDLTPLLYNYLQDLSAPPAPFFSRQSRAQTFLEHHDSQHQTPPPPARRAKRKPTAPITESSSDESKPRPSPRRTPHTIKPHEPTITEAGAQFLRVCHNSVSRTLKNIFNSFMSYISGAEDKKDVQMALVIFLVLIAGLMMFGLSDSRTIHHHHWEFFNPPDGKQ